jgi:hypothetical protein
MPDKYCSLISTTLLLAAVRQLTTCMWQAHCGVMNELLPSRVTHEAVHSSKNQKLTASSQIRSHRLL